MQAKSWQIFVILLIMSSLLLLFYVMMGKQTVSPSEVSLPAAEVNKQPDKIKRHVFFDLGTNNGDSVKYFIDTANRSNKELLKGYGSFNEISWEIYAVEANPYFNQMLGDLKKYCEKLGHTINLMTETAAWTKNEKLVFYLDTINAGYNYWGSSLIKEHPDVINSGFKNVTVNGIDISELLKKYNADDEIIMKIDIEGTEFDLLLHLIKEGTLHLVDIIAVEFHQRLLNNFKFPPNDLQRFFNDYFKFFNVTSIPWY